MIAEIAEYLAQAVVTHPDEVRVVEEIKPGRVAVNLTVARDDFGRVIGRNGQTIEAIRTLVRVAAARHQVEATVEVVDPETGLSRG